MVGGVSKSYIVAPFMQVGSVPICCRLLGGASSVKVSDQDSWSAETSEASIRNLKMSATGVSGRT